MVPSARTCARSALGVMAYLDTPFKIQLDEFKKRNISIMNAGQFWEVKDRIRIRIRLVKTFCLELWAIIILKIKRSTINICGLTLMLQRRNLLTFIPLANISEILCT